MSTTYWSEYLINRIRDVEICHDPFTHYYLSTAFPWDFYGQLVTNIPEQGVFDELRHKDAMQPDGRSTRLQFNLGQPKHCSRLSEIQRVFWNDVFKGLSSDELRIAIFQKLERDISVRFQCPSVEIPVTPRILLLRDLPGYRIGVHSDIESKVVTVQFYLPTSVSQLHLGTRLHRKNAQDSGYVKVKQFHFAPNSGYAFAVTPSNCAHQTIKSWHSVAATNNNDGIRNSLILTYYQC